MTTTIFIISQLGPKLFLSRLLHLALALGACMPVPHPDVVAAALQTESADFASIRRSYIGNNPAHHDVLDALAVWARYGTDLLSEESSAFVNLGFVATLAAAIFEFPSHIITEKRFYGSKEKSTTILKISLQASLSTHRSVVLWRESFHQG